MLGSVVSVFLQLHSNFVLSFVGQVCVLFFILGAGYWSLSSLVTFNLLLVTYFHCSLFIVFVSIYIREAQRSLLELAKLWWINIFWWVWCNFFLIIIDKIILWNKLILSFVFLFFRVISCNSWIKFFRWGWALWSLSSSNYTLTSFLASLDRSVFYSLYWGLGIDHYLHL